MYVSKAKGMKQECTVSWITMKVENEGTVENVVGEAEPITGLYTR